MLVTTSCIEYEAHMMILVLVRAKKNTSDTAPKEAWAIVEY